MDLPALRSFAGSAAGGAVTRMARIGSGASRATFAVDVAGRDGTPRTLVLRAETGEGPLAGTCLTLAREAVVYRALQGSEVPIPRLVAAHASGEALLLERAAGEARLDALSPAGREAVTRGLFLALASLHRLDAAALDLPGFARPRDAAEALRLDLGLWRDVRRTHVDAPLPAVDLAFAWLDAHAPAGAPAPAGARAPVLCHGDAGPGNFLHEGGQVTALLDWEFAHLGDPHDDLAWVSVRSHLLGGLGDLRAGLRAWCEATGGAVDAQRLALHRALVLARMAVACAAALARAPAGGGAVYRLLLPYLDWLLPQALAAAGCDDAALSALAEAGRKGIEAVPALRDHARPLGPPELP